MKQKTIRKIKQNISEVYISFKIELSFHTVKAKHSPAVCWVKWTNIYAKISINIIEKTYMYKQADNILLSVVFLLVELQKALQLQNRGFPPEAPTNMLQQQKQQWILEILWVSVLLVLTATGICLRLSTLDEVGLYKGASE